MIKRDADMKEKIYGKLSALGWQLNRSQRETLKSSQADLRALHHLPRLDVHYLPWTTPALRPAAVATVLNEVIIHQRQQVLELGAGISTLYLANHFSKTDSDGYVVSVEEDGEWCGVVRGYLDRLNVSPQYYQVVEAPLCSYQNTSACEKWYNTDVLRSELQGQNFDLMLVDGPAAFEEGREMARLPALPFAYEYLADDFSVFLDDVERDGEEEISRCWQKKFGVDCIIVSGMGCFRPQTNRCYFDISV